MSYNFCTGKIHGNCDSYQSWPTSDRQDETSTIESETQRPRQTHFYVRTISSTSASQIQTFVPERADTFEHERKKKYLFSF